MYGRHCSHRRMHGLHWLTVAHCDPAGLPLVLVSDSGPRANGDEGPCDDGVASLNHLGPQLQLTRSLSEGAFVHGVSAPSGRLQSTFPNWLTALTVWQRKRKRMAPRPSCGLTACPRRTCPGPARTYVTTVMRECRLVLMPTGALDSRGV
jgi:hypothetical protein